MASDGEQQQVPLQIAVVGLGGIGSTFAFYLARAGLEVTAVARPDSLRFRQIAQEQAIVQTDGMRAPLIVADRLDESKAFDLVLVTTLAHQLPAVLPALQNSKASRIHFMFNTISPETIQAAPGLERCTFGMPFVMSQITSQGKLNAVVTASRKTLHESEFCAALFNHAGIHSSVEPQMQLWLRCHAPLCVAFESIAVLSHSQNKGASWAQCMQTARGLKAGLTIVKALGNELYPAGKALMHRLPTTGLAAMFWGLSRNLRFRELLATGSAECKSLTDEIVKKATPLTGLSRSTIAAFNRLRPVD